MPPKRLFLIDAMAMAFRNYHAFGVRPLMTSKGEPTSAVFGSAQFMMKLLEDEKPDYIALVTDTREPTFRHKLAATYKANRSAMPEDLAKQLPHFFQLFEAMGCKVLRQSGFEADDIIGSIAKQLSSSDIHTYIVSGDKDFMQLVDENTSLYIPKKGGETIVLDAVGVKERFGCDPIHVIDILALLGDSSDNVKGVSGVGEKGAAKLVAEFGSLESIYENVDKIKNDRLRESLIRDRDQAFLAKKLVTIDVGMELNLALEDLQCDYRKMTTSAELLKLFNDLEFKRLQDKVKELRARQTQNVETATPAPVATINSLEHGTVSYQLINTAEAFQQLISRLNACEAFCFDSETTGLDPIGDEPIGISIAMKEAEAFYIPLAKVHLDGSLLKETVIAGLKPFFADTNKLKIGHHLKFDIQMLRNIGIETVGPFADTMVCSYLLESTAKSHGLDHCCLKFLNYEKIPTSSLMGPKNQTPMLEAPLPLLTTYACEDADYTLRLYHVLMPRLKSQGLEHVFRDIEMPLVPIIATMEQCGVYVDAKVLGEISTTLERLAGEMEAKIYEIAGETFNINSTKQLQVILFEKLKIHELLGFTRLKKTKSGFSTDVSVLEKLSAHPLPKTILEYRTVTKLKNTYVDTLPLLINPKSHRVHTHFHQTGTATGRLSSSDPNLQNIPIRSTMGKEIRRAFCVQKPDHVYISADYSQVELRLLAHIAKDDALAEAFRNGADIHAATAAKIFGIALDAVTPDMRSQAKAINFGIIYGMGPNRLARTTGVSFKEAKDFIEKYFQSYPAIGNYIEESIASAKKNGYTITLSGRKRPIPEIYSKDAMLLANAENIAVNSPIQGSAADLIKLAMIKIAQQFDEQHLKVRMLLQVHDELVFECPEDELERAKPIIKNAMESAMKLDVPVEVEMGVGTNWLEAH
jgi:DNA polymerase-1